MNSIRSRVSSTSAAASQSAAPRRRCSASARAARADRRRALCVKATASHPIAWDMRARNRQFTLEGAERMHNEIVEGAFRHDGDPRVRQHVHNARRRPNQYGVSFGKETRESSRKIDALAAGTLSRMARRAYLALPRSKQRRQRTGRAMAL